jgi:hypothetical protein
LFFGEIPDIWVCLGGLIIISAITYLTHREVVASRSASIRSGESEQNRLA